MRRAWKRVGIYLLIGLIVNVAIAWMIPTVLRGNWFNAKYDIEGQSWPVSVPADWPPAEYWSSMSAVGYDGVTAMANLDDLARTRRLDPSVVLYVATRHAYGLPFHAMTARQLQTQQGRSIREVDEGPFYRGFAVGLLHYPAPYRRIALFPLWPGCIANTLIYGLLAWLVVSAARRWRMARRRKSRLCPTCGYDYANLDVCPECGWSSQQPGSPA